MGIRDYKINRYDDIPKIVKGKYVFKMFGYRFFIYNSADNEGTAKYFPHQWRVCEESSGSCIVNKCNENDAIQTAKELLKAKGKSKVVKKVKETIQENHL